ncbi:MAG: hypothetical protein ACLP0L_04885 [Solirubrobacteraceae bacterium]
MPRSVRRFTLLSGVALCGILGGPIAVAQASDNSLRATLNSYAPKIVKDENAVRNGLNGYPQGRVKPLIHALTHEIGDLHSLKSKLAHDSASSAAGAKGKKDIVKGLTLIANAYGALRHDVQVANGGPVAAAKVNAAVSTDKKGRKKLLAGLKLLGG